MFTYLSVKTCYYIYVTTSMLLLIVNHPIIYYKKMHSPLKCLNSLKPNKQISLLWQIHRNYNAVEHTNYDLMVIIFGLNPKSYNGNIVSN